MNEVAFRVERQEFPDALHDVVNLYVDGQRMQDIARRVEQPFADAEGKPGLAGSYVGIDARLVRWPSRHFLGEPEEYYWLSDGRTMLLGCGCGEAPCWPLSAYVEVAERTVTWRAFRTGYRDWDWSNLGPVVFDRAQYEQALRATAG